MDYTTYTLTYNGDSIPETDFHRLIQRAEEEVRKFERLYTVSYPEAYSRDMALCAVADTLYYFEQVGNGLVFNSSKIGEVSTSATPTANVKDQGKEVYKAFKLHADVYRGAR